TTSFAQGTKSLSFGLPDSNSPIIDMGYFLQTDGELRLELFLDFIFSQGGATSNSAYNFGAGLAYRAYFHRVGQIAPFLQPSFSVQRVAGTPTTSGSARLRFGVGLGAEYVFAPQFSVDGVLSLSLDVSNLGGDGKVGAALSTSTSQLFAKA